MPIRVAIADDHALFRQGLRSMLRLHAEVEVVAEVERVEEIAPALEATPCDVLLLDLQMDRDALGEIATLARRIAVVVVTASERPEDAIGAIRAGARGLVFKRFAIETLMKAIGTVMEGHVWLPPEVQAELSARMREPAESPLTQREREIVRHVALGLRNAEVAAELGITEVTVKSHLNNVFQKLDLRDRVQLTWYAIRTGIVGLDAPRPGRVERPRS
jgi:two-component system NarL family response regulator